MKSMLIAAVLLGAGIAGLALYLSNQESDNRSLEQSDTPELENAGSRGQHAMG